MISSCRLKGYALPSDLKYTGIHSTCPFSSKSEIYSFAGWSASAFIFEFNPLLPATRSGLPSPSISATARQFHQPEEFAIAPVFWSLPLMYFIIATGIQAPTTTMAFLPDPSMSTHCASVTIPSFCSSGASDAVTSVKLPCPSFLNNLLDGITPYTPGTLLAPIKRSPLSLFSLTHDALIEISGHPLNLRVKFPLPSLL